MSSWDVFSSLVEFVSCVIFVAFFTGFESAFASMSKVKLRNKVAQGVYGADFLEMLYNSRERFLGFTLVGMTLAFVGGTVVAVEFFKELARGRFDDGLVPLFATMTVVPCMFFFGELLPRTIARRYADEAVFLFARPVMMTYAFFYVPVVLFTSSVTRFFMWLLGTSSSGLESRASREELRLLVRLGEKEGIVEQAEGELIESIFDFHGKTAQDVLCPRTSVKALPDGATIGDVITLMMRTGHSRIPLYRGSLDHILGIVHVFDVICSGATMEQEAIALMKTIPTVPAGKPLDSLLAELQSSRNQMAVVVGERGETIGIITMEDILEEIVGEIRDEFDGEEPSISQVAPSMYLVDTRVSRHEFERAFRVRLPDGDYDSFGGFLLQLWRRIPERGEERRFGGLSISIVRADRHRVYQARVVVLARNETAEPADEVGGQGTGHD